MSPLAGDTNARSESTSGGAPLDASRNASSQHGNEAPDVTVRHPLEAILAELPASDRAAIVAHVEALAKLSAKRRAAILALTADDER